MVIAVVISLNHKIWRALKSISKNNQQAQIEAKFDKLKLDAVKRYQALDDEVALIEPISAHINQLVLFSLHLGSFASWARI